jgi:glycoprotein 2-beta-D-xylosyltransferase
LIQFSLGLTFRAMVARPLVEKVPGDSSAPCPKRLRLWGSMVVAMAVVSLLNLSQSFSSLQSAASSSTSARNDESVVTPKAGMFPVEMRRFQYSIHHQVQEEYEDGGEAVDDEVERVAPSVQWPPNKGSKEDCMYTKDYGLLERLANSSRLFCDAGSNDSNSSSPYTVFHVPQAGLTATMLHNFELDIRGAKVAKDITSLADDGGGHDPRLRYMKNSTFCSCATRQDRVSGAPNIWKDFFVGGPGTKDPNCVASQTDPVGEKLTLSRAVVLVRRDDHNPFFQISAMFNAWVMMRTVGWDRNTTQLVTLDRALPTPIDELRHALLAPERPVVSGAVFQRQVVRLESALLTPYEYTGPLMSHLDDNQPCHANAMLAKFRDEALKSVAVTPRNAKTDPRRCLVTVISRRPYSGRRIQRVWQNEDEILRRMREEYHDAYRHGECEFQALEFVNMTVQDQMRAMLDSDVVIGMHGAGMANVLWTRPETLVIEIFPRRRFRWGYRNMCQFLGCKWHEFRRGRDVRVHSSDPTDMDKVIPYPQWKSFFDPLFRNVLDDLELRFGGE